MKNKINPGIILMIVLICRPCWAGISKQESISKFVMGNQAYKEGNYEKAIEDYQSIIQGQIESGQVYYNLGNAYFKSGKLGYAVLNYQRAKRLIPRDSDLIFNLDYAQSLIRKTNSEEKGNFLDVLIQGHINFYTVDEMVLIMTVLTALVSFFHLLSKFCKWKNFVSKGIRGTLLILVLVNAAGLYFKISIQSNLAIMVRPAKANFEPNKTAVSHFELSEGVPIKVVQEKDGWIKIRRADGRFGWVEKTSLEKI
ncbi:MAG: SH3 domain-containing protein [Candidatus Omnitrophota bacterium]